MRLLVLMLVACGAPQTRAVVSNGAIAGVISGRQGVPANSAVVMAYRDGRWIAQVVTDAQGRYRLELPAGSYRLEIYHRSDTVLHDAIVVTAGRATEFDTITDPLARCAAENRLDRAITNVDRDAAIAAALGGLAQGRFIAGGKPLSQPTAVVLPASATLAALPLAPRPMLVPVTLDGLTADVARTHVASSYWQVDVPHFEGACGVVSISGGVLDPNPAKSQPPNDPGRWLVTITASGPVLRGQIEISSLRLVEGDGGAN